MNTRPLERPVPVQPRAAREPPNGAAWAAMLASAIGAFATGLIVVLNEAGLVAVPALYAPAGGVSGRTTLAVLIWLGAWAVLHFGWRHRRIDPRRAAALIAVLVLLGVLGTFPPLWTLL